MYNIGEWGGEWGKGREREGVQWWDQGWGSGGIKGEAVVGSRVRQWWDQG